MSIQSRPNHQTSAVWLVITIVCLAIVASGGVAAMGATETQGDPCQTVDSEGSTAVVVLPGDQQPAVDSVELYPATTAFLFVCEDGAVVESKDGQQWEVNTTEGIENASPTESGWQLDLGHFDGPIATPTIIEGHSVDDGVVIEPVDVGVQESSIDTVETVALGDSATLSEYREAESVYLQALGQLDEELAQLEDRAESVETQGLDEQQYDRAVESLETLDRTWLTIQSEVAVVQRLLFEAIFTVRPAEDHNVQALESVAESEQTTQRAAEERLTHYETVIESERASAERSMREFIRPGVLIGAVLGITGGFVVTKRKKREYETNKKVSPDARYDLRSFLRPIAAGIGALLLGGGLLLYSGILSTMLPMLVIV